MPTTNDRRNTENRHATFSIPICTDILQKGSYLIKNGKIHHIMKETKIYKCFIASPSDTKKEREICDKIFDEINSGWGNAHNFRIQSIKWEKDAVPAMGEPPQSIINKQLISEEFELFIGILYARMGTPTEEFNSGTEEEFSLVLEKHEKFPNDIRIMMYFNTASIEQKTLNTYQFDAVQTFKELCKEKGLYSEYSGIDDFAEKLRTHLSKYFTEVLKLPVLSNSNNKNIVDILQERLDNALSYFEYQPIIWADRVLCKSKKISRDSLNSLEDRIDIEEFIKKPTSLLIQSPPQFGLTCFAHHLVIKAYKKDSAWLYLDAEKIRQSKIEIERVILRECKALEFEPNNINCIVLDSWEHSGEGMMKLLRNLIQQYQNTPIIVMQRMSDFKYSDEKQAIKIDRNFETVRLLGLHKNGVREVVSAYNSKKNINDDDIVLNRVIKDLDALNIHRTPYNCLTLLTILERDFDKSPVNRTQMIEMILFMLFNHSTYPRYSTKPDVKDCEVALGYFCEKMIKKEVYSFSKKEFEEDIRKFCDEKLIDIEVSDIFNILYQNRIIASIDTSMFAFKYSFWIYYFAAKRMYFDENFRDYILHDKKYIVFPEVIEFYTGIDRKRTNVVKLLTEDLRDQRNTVEQKIGGAIKINPLNILKWKASKEDIANSYQQIKKSVIDSNVPEEIKDEYNDEHYDSSKPYNQGINHYLIKYDCVSLLQEIRASSRALRNSDYIDALDKKNFFKEITQSWTLLVQIIFLLAPVLAKEGKVNFDGWQLVLDQGFDKVDEKEKVIAILREIPSNIIMWFQDDLYSEKIAPLLYETVQSSSNHLDKIHIILLLINYRPKGWHIKVRHYFDTIPYDSIYLWIILNVACAKYQFDFVSDNDLGHLHNLIKMCHAKHIHKNDKHWLDKINTILDIPKREIDD